MTISIWLNGMVELHKSEDETLFNPAIQRCALKPKLFGFIPVQTTTSNRAVYLLHCVQLYS